MSPLLTQMVGFSNTEHMQWGAAAYRGVCHLAKGRWSLTLPDLPGLSITVLTAAKWAHSFGIFSLTAPKDALEQV